MKHTLNIDLSEIIKALIIGLTTALLTGILSYVVLIKVLEERSIATRNTIDSLVVRMDKFETRIDQSLSKIINDLYSPKFSQTGKDSLVCESDQIYFKHINDTN